MSRAVVTGATGLVGLHVVEALQTAGIEVRAFARPSSDISRLAARPVEIVSGRLDDPAAARRAIAGADWVIHAAGRLPLGRRRGLENRPGPYRIVNVEATEIWLCAALDAGVERFVYVSSASVYSLDARAPIAECAPLGPPYEYGISKLAAEERVRRYQAQGLPTTIIRPCVLYGTGDRYFLPIMLRLARLPLLPLVNGGHALFDVAHALDVAELIYRACRVPSAAGAIYNAGPGEAMSLRDIFDTIRQVVGHGPRIVAVPAGVVEFLARLAHWPTALLFPSAESLVTPAGVADLSRDGHLDITRARQELGYAPRFKLAQGLAATLRPPHGMGPPH